MILLHHAYGQLANRMILIIHFTAYCLDRKISLSITNFEQYLELFDDAALKSLEDQSITFRKHNLFDRMRLSMLYRLGNIPKLSRLIDIRKSHDLKDQTFNMEQLDDLVQNYRYVVPEGWLFRCTTLTEKHRKDIVQLFQPDKVTKAKINVFFEQVPLDRIKVGVHIRRRDYREFLEGKYFYNDEIYLSLMDQIEKLFKDKEIQFLVFSDEPVSNLIRSRQHVLVSENSFIEDFFSMSMCDYLMGPPSTFTLVAAYLGKCKLAHIEEEHHLSLSIDQFQTINRI
ncbi:MAG: hypothetical protein EP305_03245 [Bacteroidetes bacterium]|nr:MAG: hypothetical protein EP305_03245 [Bacteroidota bacterium]